MSLFVEMIDWKSAREEWKEWSELGERAIEKNVFLLPEFAIPLIQSLPVSKRPNLFFVWEQDFESLVGVFAIHVPTSKISCIARGWHNNMMALGTPLVDASYVDDVIAAIHDHITKFFPQISLLIFPEIDANGSISRAVLRLAQNNGVEANVLDERTRAIALPGFDLEAHISRKRRRRLAYYHDRLCKLGKVEYKTATNILDVHIAVEKFMVLEHSGWKGEGETSLMSDSTLTSFARSMIMYFAQKGNCRIDSIELDGKPIAMGIVLQSGNDSFYWKTAYDEAYAKFSPGVLLTVYLTKNVMDSGFTTFDSCSMPNHPMIDSLWSVRREMGDVYIATRKKVGLALKYEKARRYIRSLAKTAYHKIRKQ